jgi:CubicO group peptidase (beta-lactamase class C family)
MVHKGKTDCQPGEVGYNPEILDILDNHFLDLIQKGTIQAAGYLLARHGKVFALRTMGKQSSLEDKGDFMPDNLRPIASITKVFTTTAVLQLLEKGKLPLWQNVSEILKEFDTEMFRHIMKGRKGRAFILIRMRILYLSGFILIRNFILNPG